MRISILIGLIAILSACATSGHKHPTEPGAPAYTPKFKAGDCAKYDPESWENSDGTEFVIAVVGKRKYRVIFKHHSFRKRSKIFARIRSFDQDFKKTECNPVKIMPIPHEPEEDDEGELIPDEIEWKI